MIQSNEFFLWNDQLGGRRRPAFLLFILNDEVFVFEGKNIPGVCVVVSTKYTSQGVWSYTTFTLKLADGVRPIEGNYGFSTGRFVEGLAEACTLKNVPGTWAEFAKALGVSIVSAIKFLRSYRPKAAEKFDAVDSALNDLEDSQGENSELTAKIITVSFGGPTNRAIREGFWVSNKFIEGFEGAYLRIKTPDLTWTECKVSDIEIVGLTGKVLDVSVSYPYVSIKISVLS